MPFLGQEYKQGLVIQRSEKGSAFQEVVDTTIGKEGVIETQYSEGIKKVIVKTTEESGKPLEFEELPEASEDYVGKFALYANNYYLCTEEDETYLWVQYAPVAEENEEVIEEPAEE